MRYFRQEIGGPKVNIYPLVCWHIGAKQSSIKFIQEVIRQIQADPLARWIYMGDAGECVTKSSKGNIYEQLLNPGDQLRVAADLLIPIRDKGLFGIRGNHGNRVDKDSGLGWDETLCARVGIPYMGVSALGSLILSKRNMQVPATVYTHHGSSGSVAAGGKLMAGKKPEAYIDADVILTAHHHGCGPNWPFKQEASVNNRMRRIEWKTVRSYSCGSAYDSRSGYAEEKQYTPLIPEHIVIELGLREVKNERGNGTAVLDVNHRTIEGFDSKYIIAGDAEKWSGKEPRVEWAQASQG